MIRPIAIVLLIALSSCGETTEEGDGCVCDAAMCAPATCTLRVINECPDQWGEARVFIGDSAPGEEPDGVATDQTPYASCEGFAVGEAFTFVVESENGRSVSNTVGDTFMCQENRPFEFRLVCTQ